MRHLYYFDANILIYNFEGNDLFHKQLDMLNMRILNQNAQIATSYLSYAECLRLPFKNNNHTLIKTYQKFFKSKSIVVKTPTKSIIEKAADISVMYNFKLIDSLHLATAITLNCSSFITNDHKLSRIKDIPILILSEMTS
jgi:predicted nucleic acid-binding protein